MTLFLTFSPTADDTIRTSLPKEIRLAIRSHKALFYTGGLLLTVTSYVADPPVFIFQMALLTLLCLEHADQVPTPTERPRQISDVIADVTPQGHAPWLRRLLSSTKEDPIEGARPLSWLTPSLIPEGSTLTWLSAGNIRTLRPNKTSLSTRGPSLKECPNPLLWIQGPNRHTFATTSSSPSRTHGCITVHYTGGPTRRRNTDFTPSPSPSSSNWLRHHGHRGYPPSLFRSTPHRGQHLKHHPLVLQSQRT
jgi:hypothetical protein